MTYTTPTAAELKARYPAFASVADATVDVWIADAEGPVGANWDDAERANGVILFAAHNMALIGLGGAPAGVTSFKSGTFAVTVSDKLAGASGIYATIYGRMYAELCRRLFGGARVVKTADHV